jgi:hypothetical protein
MIVIVIAVLVGWIFYYATSWNWNPFAMSNIFLRMEYAIKLKLFKVITFIVTVKLINKIIRSA